MEVVIALYENFSIMSGDKKLEKLFLCEPRSPHSQLLQLNFSTKSVLSPPIIYNMSLYFMAFELILLELIVETYFTVFVSILNL